ncbi:MAG: hypothetical protein IJ448_01490 [Oscillospiraceae bacterium]|nr:hypothetical protein [Oscillospiraceae bacterium]
MVMRDGFTFGAKSTKDFSMHAEKYPAIGGPQRKRTTVSVAGRNGDLHYTENAFQNYAQSYDCYFHGEQSAPEMAHAVKAWLLGSGAYQRLEDPYDPDHFRLATFAGPLDIENQFNRYGRCVVNFDCAPQAFLKSGEFPESFTAAGELLNPTAFTALPLITLYGTGAGTLTVGGVTVTIHEIEDEMILDCEMQNAYRQTDDNAVENMNSCIYAPEFPALAPGSNIISWTGDITGVKIIPRWWEL